MHGRHLMEARRPTANRAPPPRVGAAFGSCAAAGIAVAGGAALGLATDGFYHENRCIRSTTFVGTIH